MRFNFSIRTALIVTAIVAIATAGTLVAYNEHVATRTRLEWLEFDPKCLDTITETRWPILISMKDLTFTKQPNRQFYLEYDSHLNPKTEFRRFVHRHKISLYTFGYTFGGRYYNCLLYTSPSPRDRG